MFDTIIRNNIVFYRLSFVKGVFTATALFEHNLKK